MELQGAGGPLPIAALSLHAFAPHSIYVQRAFRSIKTTGPSSVAVIRDGPRSHPIDASLARDVAESERAGQDSARPHRHLQALTRLVVSIPGALSRLVSAPPSQSAFMVPSRLSDMRVFPSVVPKRAARGGGAVPGGGAARKVAVMWFRNDLRLHDNPSLERACREGTSVLPVYVFDPRDYGKGPKGFGRTGPARAQFILDAVSDLRSRLRDAGSDLLVRVGRPEEVVPELAAAVGAGAVYCQTEVTEEEMKIEGRVKAALDRDGSELRALWGGTLYHLEDLPFQLSAMPTTYADFRARMAGLSVRPLVASEREMKGLPQATGLELGDLPSLQQLGLPALQPKPLLTTSVGSGGFGAPPLTAAVQALRGGETEALKHLNAFISEVNATFAKTEQRQRQMQLRSGGFGASDGMTPATNSASSSFSCRISPWLALGCLSPRRMYLEMKQQLGGQDPLKISSARTTTQQQQGARGAAAAAEASDPSGSAGPANWLVYELLWRDFFRFVAQKYDSKVRPTTTAKAAAATPRVIRSAVAASATAGTAAPAYVFSAA